MKFRAISNILNIEFVRFVLVGMLNTIFSYCVYALFIFFHSPYWLAGIMQIVLGIAFSFKTIGFLVFKSSDNRLIFKFVVGYTAVAIVYLVTLKLFHAIYPNGYLAGAFAIIPQALLSFIINKLYIFRNAPSGSIS